MRSHYIGQEPEKNYGVEVVLGRVPGVGYIGKFGECHIPSSGDVPMDVWTGATAIIKEYPWPSTAQPVYVQSTSANDDGVVGTVGAHIVRLYGLDANYNEITEDITLERSTWKVTSASFLRTYRAQVIAAGSDEVNFGDIEFRHGSGAGDLICHIPAGYGQTQMLIYTVPAGKTAVIHAFRGSCVKKNDGTATVELWARPVNKVRAMVGKAAVSVSAGSISYDANMPPPVPEKTDLYIRCSFTSTNALDVAVRLIMTLHDN